MDKKTAKKNLIYSFALMAGALIVAGSAVFGWFMAEDASTNDFFLQISGASTEVGLHINDVYYGGGDLVLEDAYPTTEYLFKISVIPAYDGHIRLTFAGIDGEFYDENFEMHGDMQDVFAIRYPLENPEYILLSDLDNGLILDDAPAYQGQETDVEFLLFFNDQAPEGIDINLYQNKSLTIKRLIIEVY